MSVRFFCDSCARELEPHEQHRLQGRYRNVSFEVIVGVDGVWNSGHVCRRCLLKAIDKVQDAEPYTPEEMGEMMRGAS